MLLLLRRLSRRCSRRHGATAFPVRLSRLRVCARRSHGWPCRERRTQARRSSWEPDRASRPARPGRRYPAWPASRGGAPPAARTERLGRSPSAAGPACCRHSPAAAQRGILAIRFRRLGRHAPPVRLRQLRRHAPPVRLRRWVGVRGPYQFARSVGLPGLRGVGGVTSLRPVHLIGGVRPLSPIGGDGLFARRGALVIGWRLRGAGRSRRWATFLTRALAVQRPGAGSEATPTRREVALAGAAPVPVTRVGANGCAASRPSRDVVGFAGPAPESMATVASAVTPSLAPLSTAVVSAAPPVPPLPEPNSTPSMPRPTPTGGPKGSSSPSRRR